MEGISAVKSEFLEQILGSVLPTLGPQAFWVNAIFAMDLCAANVKTPSLRQMKGVFMEGTFEVL